MGRLTPELRRKLLEALLKVPNIGDQQLRDQLLSDLSQKLWASIPRSPVPLIDLNNILTTAEGWDETALGQLLDNALLFVAGSSIGEEISTLRQRLGEDGRDGEARAVLQPPYPPEPWADRPEFAELQRRLLAGGRTVLSAEGRGGIGKTALAQKLAWDPYVRAAYPDGVLWVALGPQPDVPGALAALAAGFGVDLRDTLETAARADRVRFLLADKHCLLIVDDVWDTDVATLFRDIAPTALLTTRQHDVARAFAPPRQDLALAELAPDAAIALLRELAPAAAETPLLEQVAIRADGLPLAMRLIAPLLDEHVEMGWDLAAFLTQLDTPAWRTQKLARLDEIMSQSLDFLSDADRAAFIQLAVFGAHPADFDLPAAIAVWDADEETARERLLLFRKRNLVDPNRASRVSLHQSLAAIAARRLPADDPAYQRHVAYYLALVNRDQEDWRTIAAELQQIRRAWEVVMGDDEQVLEFIRALHTFHEHHGLRSEEISWVERGLRAAQSLKLLGVEAALRINIGRAYHNLGQPRQALVASEKALSIFELLNDPVGQATALDNLGWIYHALGEPRKALTYYKQGASIWEALGESRALAQARTSIGDMYRILGMPHRALTYHEEALKVFIALGDQRWQAVALKNYGVVYYTLGEPHRAIEYLERALPLWETIGDRRSLATTLAYIGLAYDALGELEQAMTYHQQARTLYELVGDQRGMANSLANFGRIYRARGNPQQALAYYTEALPLLA